MSSVSHWTPPSLWDSAALRSALESSQGDVCVIGITGPTASGKTALAISLAQQYNGEIVNADLMQLYAGMEIGTAQPTSTEQAAAIHHLYGTYNPLNHHNLAQYLAVAKPIVMDIIARGKRPILVGGSGLALEALLYGYEPAPAVTPELRQEIINLSDQELYSKLIESENDTIPEGRRHRERAYERALMHCTTTTKTPPPWQGLLISCWWEPDALRERITERTKQIYQEGLIQEVSRLIVQGVPADAPTMQSIGYPEVVEYLRGGRTLESAQEITTKRTIQYAKRQRTWWRRPVVAQQVHWLQMYTLLTQ